MLPMATLEQARALVDRLDGLKLAVTPVAQSPLATLVTASRIDKAIVRQENGKTWIDYELAEKIVNVQDEKIGVNFHDAAMDDLVAHLAPMIQEHIQFARGVVSPEVEELATRVKKSIEALTPSELLGAQVVTMDQSPLLKNSAFEQLIAGFTGAPYNSPKLTLNLPDLTTDELVELMMTGHASIDQDIEAWLATEGRDWLLDLWGGVFQIKPRSADSTKRVFLDWTEDRECGVDYALAIFLLSHKLNQHPLEGSNIDLKTLESVTADFRVQAAQRIQHEIEKVERYEKNKVLVLSNYRLTAYVQPQVYREYIEAGGTNEALFGNLLRQTPYVMLRDVAEHQAALQEDWARHCASVSRLERINRLSHIKAIFTMHFRELLAEAVSREEGLVNNAETVLAKFMELVAQITEEDLSCIYKLSLKLVCLARFPEKAAYDILLGIDRNAEQNKSLSVREAATLAIMEYICDWLVAQMKVVAR